MLEREQHSTTLVRVKVMDVPSDTHSFVVKVYDNGEGQLQGHITHALSQKRASLQGIEDIVIFIAPYIESMSVKLRIRSRLILWLSRGGRATGRFSLGRRQAR